MGWYKELNEDLVDLVLKGKKPGADVNPGVYEAIEKGWGLENIISKSPFYYTYNDGERALVGYCISIMGKKVSDAVTPMDMAFYADLDDANDTYLEFEGCYIDSALQKLFTHPNRSVATECLIGELLGYEPCCIRYYAETRWMGKPDHDLDIRKNQSYHKKLDRNSHVLCKDCKEDDAYVTEPIKSGKSPVQ